MATSSDPDHPTDLEPNTDPLTGQPGAHPVGASIGAVSAGAAGAAIGAVGGPIGVVVGAIVGAVAGALIGKETAEAVNPTDPSALAKGQAGEMAATDDVPAMPPVATFPPDGVPMTTTATPDTPVFLSGSSSDPLPQNMAASAIAAGLAMPGTFPEEANVPAPHGSHHPEETAATAAAAPATHQPPPASVVPPTPPMTTAVTTAVAAAAVAAPGAASSRPSGRLQRITAASAPTPPPVELVVRESYPEENVRHAAYFRYLHRVEQGMSGDELTDWVEAEREVLRG